MIADISSLDGCSESAPLRARDPTLPSPPVADHGPCATPDQRLSERMAEQRRFALAYRQFDSLLPAIEALSADLE